MELLIFTSIYCLTFSLLVGLGHQLLNLNKEKSGTFPVMYKTFFLTLANIIVLYIIFVIFIGYAVSQQ